MEPNQKLSQKSQQKQKVLTTGKILLISGFSIITILAGVIIGFSLINTPESASALNPNFTTVASGNWNNASVWSGSGTPGKGDVVKIEHDVTVKTNTGNVDSILLNGSNLIIDKNGSITTNYLDINTSFTSTGKYGSTVLNSKLKVKKGNIQVDGDIDFHLNNGNGSPKLIVNKKGTLKIKGSFKNQNNGSINVKKGGLLTYNGGSSQTLPKDANATIHKLKIDNSGNTSPQVTLSGNLTINDSLILDNGVIKTTNNKTLKIASNGAMRGWNVTNSYIDGAYSKVGSTNDSLIFNLKGANTNTVKVAIHGLSNQNTFEADYFKKNPQNAYNNKLAKGSNLSHISPSEYWQIKKTSGNSVNCKVSLFWNANNPTQISNISNKQNLVLAHYNNSKKEWENYGQTKFSGSVSNKGHITSKSVTSFSPFTFGSTNSNSPLPVELIAFNVEKVRSEAKLKWQTASETNNNHFKIQKRTEGENFKNIGTIEGEGTTTEEQSYAFIDKNPEKGNNYYRLKQVDHDGSFEYSDIKVLKMTDDDNTKAAENPIRVEKITPNPFNSSFKVNYQLDKPAEVKVYLRNSMGQVKSNQIIRGQKGSNTFSYDKGSRLEEGTYLLTLINRENKVTKKLIKR